MFGMNCGDGFSGVYVSPNSLSCTCYKHVQLFVCQSYLNKVFFFKKIKDQ